MKDLYPEFAESVDLYAVNYDLSESIESVNRFAQNQEYTFPVAQPPNGDMAADFGVTHQSTKVAFGGDGVIVYRDGFGQGNADTWRQVFQDLSNKPTAASPTAAPATMAVIPAAPTATVPPAPTATVPPAPTAIPPTVAPPTATVPPAPTATVPPAPTATVPPAPTATVPPAPTATVPPAPTATVPPAPTATVPPAPTATVPPAPTATVPPAPTAAPAIPIGGDVGERAPDFEMTLADGSVVTLASLIAAERPTFLFFFATF